MDSVSEEKELTFEEICRIVRFFAAEYGMKRVYLFGSRARRDNCPDSDFDFCILPDKGCSLIRLSGFRLDLIEAIGHDVDIVCEDSIRDDFSRIIMSDRILVYES